MFRPQTTGVKFGWGQIWFTGEGKRSCLVQIQIKKCNYRMLPLCSAGVSMSFWICCNCCFLPPGADRKLALTTCGHIICSVCFQKGELTWDPVCTSMCAAPCMGKHEETETSVGLGVILHFGSTQFYTRWTSDRRFQLNFSQKSNISNIIIEMYCLALEMYRVTFKWETEQNKGQYETQHLQN